MRKLARRLLDLEAADPRGTGGQAHHAARVCEKLRDSLTRFAGADGFASLLRRAVALAQAEVPARLRITIKPDCSIEGLDGLAADAPSAEAGALVVTHLLGLLETFIGAALTLRLVREAWPDVSLEE